MRDKELKSSKYSLPIFTIAIVAIPALTLFGVCSYFEYQMMQPMPSTLVAIEDLAEIDLPDDTMLVCSEQQDGMDRYIEAKLSVPGGAKAIRQSLENLDIAIKQIEDLSSNVAWPELRHCTLDLMGPFEIYEYNSSTSGSNRFLFTPTSDNDGVIFFIGFSI